MPLKYWIPIKISQIKFTKWTLDGALQLIDDLFSSALMAMNNIIFNQLLG